MRPCARRTSISVASLLLIAALTGKAGWGTVLLGDDAEQGIMETAVTHTNPPTTPAANAWTINAPGASASTSFAHSGMYSYAFPTGSQSFAAFAAGTTPLFLKYWIYIPSSYSIATGGAQTWGAQVADIVGYTYGYNIGLENDSASSTSAPLFLIGGGQYSAQVEGTHALSRDTWHSVEAEITMGTGGTASATVWLDSNTTPEISQNNLTITAQNAVALGNTGGTGTIYYDDISVSSAASGNPVCGLTVRHPYPTNRTKMYVQSYLWGAAATDSLVASIDGTAFSTVANPAGYQAQLLNLTPLTAGPHTLAVTLMNSSGTARQTWTETISAFGGTPQVSIDENNNLVEGGHKIFPVTDWFLSSSNELSWFSSGYINNSGWVSECCGPYSPVQYASYMAKLTGMQAIGPGSGRMGSGTCTPGGTDCQATVAPYASSLTGNPGLLAWFVFDEPSVNGWSTSQMVATMNAVHSNDSSQHPYVLDDASAPYLNLSWYYPTPVADVYSSDNYPLCYHNTYQAAGKSFKDWLSMMDRDARANYGLVPNLIILELYKFYASPRASIARMSPRRRFTTKPGCR